MTALPELGNTDIYLIDQIMKDRFTPGHRILDAGCGAGRNMRWFLAQGFDITGVDQNAEALQDAAAQARSLGRDDAKFVQCPVESMPFSDQWFDWIISSAVLHFASDHAHFEAMFAEMFRVLKPGGTLWIRMTTDVGIAHLLDISDTGVCRLPDGSDRYLLTRTKLEELQARYPIELRDPFKNVNVSNVRVMCVLVLEK